MRAVAGPIPLLPPVTTATSFCKLRSMPSWLSPHRPASFAEIRLREPRVAASARYAATGRGWNDATSASAAEYRLITQAIVRGADRLVDVRLVCVVTSQLGLVQGARPCPVSRHNTAGVGIIARATESASTRHSHA
jgi:hypothetical protein